MPKLKLKYNTMKITPFKYRSLFTVLCCSIFALAAQAQVAVVNTNKILAALPEIKKADSLYSLQARKYQNDYQLRYNSTRSAILFADSLNKMDPKADAAVKATKAASEQLDQLKVLEQQSNAKITELRSKLLTPHLEKLNAVIKAKAAQMKYKQVLDIQQLGTTKPGATTDITDAIILAYKNKNSNRKN